MNSVQLTLQTAAGQPLESSTLCPVFNDYPTGLKGFASNLEEATTTYKFNFRWFLRRTGDGVGLSQPEEEVPADLCAEWCVMEPASQQLNLVGRSYGSDSEVTPFLLSFPAVEGREAGRYRLLIEIWPADYTNSATPTNSNSSSSTIPAAQYYLELDSRPSFIGLAVLQDPATPPQGQTSHFQVEVSNFLNQPVNVDLRAIRSPDNNAKFGKIRSLKFTERGDSHLPLVAVAAGEQVTRQLELELSTQRSLVGEPRFYSFEVVAGVSNPRTQVSRTTPFEQFCYEPKVREWLAHRGLLLFFALLGLFGLLVLMLVVNISNINITPVRVASDCLTPPQRAGRQIVVTREGTLSQPTLRVLAAPNLYSVDLFQQSVPGNFSADNLALAVHSELATFSPDGKTLIYPQSSNIDLTNAQLWWGLPGGNFTSISIPEGVRLWPAPPIWVAEDQVVYFVVDSDQKIKPYIFKPSANTFVTDSGKISFEQAELYDYESQPNQYIVCLGKEGLVKKALQALPASTASLPTYHEPATSDLPAFGSNCLLKISQLDPRVYNNTFKLASADLNVRKQGCSLVAAATLLTYYTKKSGDSKKNFEDYLNCLSNNVNYFPQEETEAGAITDWPQTAKGCATRDKLDALTRQKFSWENLYNSLSSNHPVIVGLQSPHFQEGISSAQAVIVLAGPANPAEQYTADTYRIFDPLDGSTFKSLAYYFRMGYRAVWLDSSGEGTAVADNNNVCNVKLLTGNDKFDSGFTIASPQSGLAYKTPPTVTITNLSANQLEARLYVARADGTFSSELLAEISDGQQLDGRKISENGIYTLVVTSVKNGQTYQQVVNFTVDQPNSQIFAHQPDDTWLSDLPATVSSIVTIQRLSDSPDLSGTVALTDLLMQQPVTTSLQVRFNPADIVTGSLSGIAHISYRLNPNSPWYSFNTDLGLPAIKFSQSGTLDPVVELEDGAGNFYRFSPFGGKSVTLTITQSTTSTPGPVTPTPPVSFPPPTTVPATATSTPDPGLTTTPADGAGSDSSEPITTPTPPPAFLDVENAVEFGPNDTSKPLALTKSGDEAISWSLVAATADNLKLSQYYLQNYPLNGTVTTSHDVTYLVLKQPNITSHTETFSLEFRQKGQSKIVTVKVDPQTPPQFEFIAPGNGATLTTSPVNIALKVNNPGSQVPSVITVTVNYRQGVGSSQVVSQTFALTAAGGWKTSWDISNLPPQTGIEIDAIGCLDSGATNCIQPDPLTGLSIPGPQITLNPLPDPNNLPANLTLSGQLSQLRAGLNYSVYLLYNGSGASTVVSDSQVITVNSTDGADTGWQINLDTSSWLPQTVNFTARVCTTYNSSQPAYCANSTPITATLPDYMATLATLSPNFAAPVNLNATATPSSRVSYLQYLFNINGQNYTLKTGQPASPGNFSLLFDTLDAGLPAGQNFDLQLQACSATPQHCGSPGNSYSFSVPSTTISTTRLAGTSDPLSPNFSFQATVQGRGVSQLNLVLRYLSTPNDPSTATTKPIASAGALNSGESHVFSLSPADLSSIPPQSNMQLLYELCWGPGKLIQTTSCTQWVAFTSVSLPLPAVQGFTFLSSSAALYPVTHTLPIPQLNPQSMSITFPISVVITGTQPTTVSLQIKPDSSNYSGSVLMFSINNFNGQVGPTSVTLQVNDLIKNGFDLKKDKLIVSAIPYYNGFAYNDPPGPQLKLKFVDAKLSMVTGTDRKQVYPAGPSDPPPMLRATTDFDLDIANSDDANLVGSVSFYRYTASNSAIVSLDSSSSISPTTNNTSWRFSWYHTSKQPMPQGKNSLGWVFCSMPAIPASCFPLPTPDSVAGLPMADNLSLLGLSISKTQPDLSKPGAWFPSNFTATVQITNALTPSNFNQFRFIAYSTISPTSSPRVTLATYGSNLTRVPNTSDQYAFQLYWPDDNSAIDPKNSVAQLAKALTDNKLTIAVQYCLVAAQNISVDDTANPNCSDPTGLEMHEIDSSSDASLKGQQAVVVTWQPYNGLGNPPYDSYLFDPPNAPPVNLIINVIPLGGSTLLTNSVVFSYTITTLKRPVETKIAKADCAPLTNSSVPNSMQCVYIWTPINVKFPKDSINTRSVTLIADMMIKNASSALVPHSERTTVNTHGSK